MQETELKFPHNSDYEWKGGGGGFKGLLGTGKLRVQVYAFHHETLQPT